VSISSQNEFADVPELVRGGGERRILNAGLTYYDDDDDNDKTNVLLTEYIFKTFVNLRLTKTCCSLSIA
jgi:hypothetical protein